MTPYSLGARWSSVVTWREPRDRLAEPAQGCTFLAVWWFFVSRSLVTVSEDAGRKRLLVVDDDIDMTAYLQILLRETYQISVTHNGSDALRAVSEEAFDGILVDLLLPGLDGASLVRELLSRGTSVPIVLTSARDDLAEQAKQSGANGYLPKPYDFHGLLETIAQVFSLPLGTTVGPPEHGLGARDVTPIPSEGLGRCSSGPTSGGLLR